MFSIGALHGGGSERQIVSALQHLDRQQFEPHLYVVSRSGPLLPCVPDDVPTAAFEERDRRPPTRIPGGMHRRRVADMTRYLREIRADVCFDRTFLMTLIAADAAWRANVPAVSTVVTDPRTGFAPVAGRFRTFKRQALSRLYRRAAAVLAVSEGAARSAEAFYRLPAGSVQTLRNGVDVDAVLQIAQGTPDSDWWNRPGSQDRSVVRIVSAGRLNHEKGFHLLIDAVAVLQKERPDRELRLALLGEGAHRDRLQHQIDAHRLTDMIRMPGFRSDAAAWYRSADIYVLPSLLEGMPNVLLEAMVCGTPVVAADCPHGPREILQDGRYGVLCASGSVTALAKGLQTILDDPEVACRRAENARKYVEAEFSQKTAVRKLEQVLCEAAAGSASGMSGF